ncbi:STAS domain-containing protein [Nocardia sp. R7R-8]|uniref:STAS domain-containing protein n=1 Tax=Nocardia sp. R7R-8 TaxID=3459304 RepID=UPI00403D8C13
MDSDSFRGHMPDPRTRLFSRLRRQGPAVVMSARGVADGFTLQTWAGDLREAMECAETSSCGLVVDTTKLEFMSWRALYLLAQYAAACRSSGVAVRLVSRNSTIAKIAPSDPVTARLPVHSTTVSALTALRLHPLPTRRADPAARRATAGNDRVHRAHRPGPADKSAR